MMKYIKTFENNNFTIGDFHIGDYVIMKTSYKELNFFLKNNIGQIVDVIGYIPYLVVRYDNIPKSLKDEWFYFGNYDIEKDDTSGLHKFHAKETVDICSDKEILKMGINKDIRKYNL